MIDRLLVWFLKCYFSFEWTFSIIGKVLKIKFAPVKMERIDGASEAKGHLAVRLSDTKTFTSRDLIDLSLYAKEAFGVKYLTIISGNSGMEREIEIKSDAKLRLFRNFEVVHDNGSDSISVNLINHDSESLFLLKLKDCFASNSTQTSDDDIFKTTLKSFTGTVLLFHFF